MRAAQLFADYLVALLVWATLWANLGADATESLAVASAGALVVALHN